MRIFFLTTSQNVEFGKRSLEHFLRLHHERQTILSKPLNATLLCWVRCRKTYSMLSFNQCFLSNCMAQQSSKFAYSRKALWENVWWIF